MTRVPQFRSWLWALLAGAALAAGSAPAQTPAVAVVRAPAWSGDDPVTDGAAEFGLLCTVAREQRDHAAGGIVGVGNRHGLFPSASEQSLHYFALRGMVVAKVARGGDLVGDPEGIFLDAGNLPEADVAALLADCLRRFGAPPAARGGAATAAELAAIRGHLAPFRQAFAQAQHRYTLVALR